MMKTGGSDMNLTKGEIIRDYVIWAERNEDKTIYSDISKEEESYYIDRESSETYMMEYSFKTMMELKHLLEEFSGLSDPSIVRKLTIDICQNRYLSEAGINDNIHCGQECSEKDSAVATLPEYVYTL